MKLTIKQENFCSKYIETGSASEAYRFAYNSENMKPETVNSKACILLAKGNIRARVDEIQKEIRTKSDITKEQILEQLKAILESDIRDYLHFTGKRIQFKNFKDLTDKQAKAIESIKRGKNGIELKLHGKSWSIERICKMLGYDASAKSEVLVKNEIDLSKFTGEELKVYHQLLVKANGSTE